MVKAGHICHNSSLIRLRGVQDVCRERTGAKEQLHKVKVPIVCNGRKYTVNTTRKHKSYSSGIRENEDRPKWTKGAIHSGVTNISRISAEIRYTF